MNQLAIPAHNDPRSWAAHDPGDRCGSLLRQASGADPDVAASPAHGIERRDPPLDLRYSTRVRVGSVHLDVQGTDCQVKVVGPHRALRLNAQAEVPEHDLQLGLPAAPLPQTPRCGSGAVRPRRLGVCPCGQGGSSRGVHPAQPETQARRAASARHARDAEQPSDHKPADAKGFCQGFLRLASPVPSQNRVADVGVAIGMCHEEGLTTRARRHPGQTKVSLDRRNAHPQLGGHLGIAQAALIELSRECFKVWAAGPWHA